MYSKEKHLEFIQNNIARMNQCSFQIKGWEIALISGLLAIFVSTISECSIGNKNYILIAIASTFLFWSLDSLYLSKERKFIGIYNDIIGINNGINHHSMEISYYEIPLNKYNSWQYSIIQAMLLPSEIFFYGCIIIGLIIVFKYF